MHGHMKNEVFLDVTLCCWVCWSWYLEWSQCLKQLLDTEECENLESHVWGLAYRLQQHNWCLLGGITLVLGSPHVDSLERAAWLVFGTIRATYTTCLPAWLHGAQPFL